MKKEREKRKKRKKEREARERRKRWKNNPRLGFRFWDFSTSGFVELSGSLCCRKENRRIQPESAERGKDRNLMDKKRGTRERYRYIIRLLRIYIP